MVHVESSALLYMPRELVIAAFHVPTILRPYSVNTGRAVQIYIIRGNSIELQCQDSCGIQWIPRIIAVYLEAGTSKDISMSSHELRRGARIH